LQSTRIQPAVREALQYAAPYAVAGYGGVTLQFWTIARPSLCRSRSGASCEWTSTNIRDLDFWAVVLLLTIPQHFKHAISSLLSFDHPINGSNRAGIDDESHHSFCYKARRSAHHAIQSSSRAASDVQHASHQKRWVWSVTGRSSDEPTSVNRAQTSRGKHITNARHRTLRT
jgi:hypothetical protein